jgi:hypothetical protein
MDFSSIHVFSMEKADNSSDFAAGLSIAGHIINHSVGDKNKQ